MSKRKGYLVKTKVCSRCERRQRAHKFRRCKKHPDGLQAWCRDCMNDWARENAA